MLPDPVHVNQFRSSGARGRYLCTAAAGAMALDAYTNGRIRVGAKDIDDRQDDHDSNGIGLNDVATAWKRGWGLTFSHGRRSWTTVRARLAKGDGLVLQGSYAVVPTAYRAQKTFTGGHAIYVSRLVDGGMRVFDPIANAPTVWPEAVVRNFYLSGLATAGWGSGATTGAGTGQTVGAEVTFADRLAAIGIPNDPTHVITAAEAARIAAELYPGVSGSVRDSVISFFTGKTVADAAKGGSSSFDPLGGIAAAIAAAPEAIGSVLINVVFLLAILVMVVAGVYMLARAET